MHVNSHINSDPFHNGTRHALAALRNDAFERNHIKQTQLNGSVWERSDTQTR